MTSQPFQQPVTVGRMVHVFTGPLSDAGPFAAIVMEVLTEATISVTIFHPRYGVPIQKHAVPHASVVGSADYPRWDWPPRV